MTTIIVKSFKELYELIGKPDVHWAFNDPNGLEGTTKLVDLSGNGYHATLSNMTIENPNNMPIRAGRFNGSSSYAVSAFVLPKRYYIMIHLTPTDSKTAVVLGSASWEKAVTSQMDGTILMVGGSSTTGSISHRNCVGKYVNAITTKPIRLYYPSVYEIIQNNIIGQPLICRTEGTDVMAVTDIVTDAAKQTRYVTLGKGLPTDGSNNAYNGLITYVKVYDLDKLSVNTFFIQDDDGKYYTLDDSNRIVTIPESEYSTDIKLLSAMEKLGFTTDKLTTLSQALVEGWFKKGFKLVLRNPKK